MTTLCLAVVAGFVVASLLQGRSRIVTVVLLVVMSTGVLADGWVDRIASIPLPQAVPDAALLRGEVVLSLPAGDVRDVVPQYQAILGGWRSVNGYSGYGPSYYQAVQYGVRAELDELFEPFRAAQDLHVLVSADAPRLRALVERQPGVVMTAHTRTRLQYRLPRRPVESPLLGENLPIQRVHASCSAAVVSKVIDRDPVSRWYCGTQDGQESLTADLGQVSNVGAVKHGFGPYAAEFPRELVIDTSVDGSSWQQAWEGNVVARVIFAALEEPKWPVMVLSFAPRPARYVRLRQVGRDSSAFWSVAELEVVGTRQ